jgi:uncharacterized protein
MVSYLKRMIKKVKSKLDSSTMLFILLVFAITIPFWVLGGMTEAQILPGIPVSAFAIICPMLAAIALVYKENKGKGVSILLGRAFDYKQIRSKVWYLPTLLMMPVIMLLSFAVLRLLGIPVPGPVISVTSTLALILLFFISALGEELGWSGYLTDQLQNKFGALNASIILGIIWAVYHYVGLIQVHRSLAWIAWWSLGTVTARIIMVWIYNNTGRSVFAAALFHMTINLTWQLFPVEGSYYDPCITSSILALAALVIIACNKRNWTRQKTAF